ncbi:MAG: hypothetical protein RJB01_1762 [Actinomycetota bacterium]|jgi:uncharacterized protein (TIGR03032 family)
MKRVVISMSGEVLDGSGSLAELIADHDITFMLEVGNPLTTLIHDLRRAHHDITAFSGASAQSDRANWIRLWVVSAQTLVSTLSALDVERWVPVPLPPSTTDFADVWQSVVPHLDSLSLLDSALRELCLQRCPEFRWPQLPAHTFDFPVLQNPTPEQAPRYSVHTPALRKLLSESGHVIAVTTYQSGYTILISADGTTVDTQYPWMYVPMGLAFDHRDGHPERLTIGIHESILYLEKSIASEDATYSVTAHTYTGDVLMHEMAYAADGSLYFCNTQYNAICRADPSCSFVPVWKPKFISEIVAEDRCHLNGLAMVGGEPRFATALAATDTKDGWRTTGGSSGVVLDMKSGGVVAQGLAMPHSPRWHDDKLWVLESGRNTLSRIDVTTGSVTPIAQVPGFGRGLAFLGGYAIVGFSKIRETVMESLPVAAQKSPGNCGICLVDLATGNVTGGMIFDSVAKEIFDVQVLPKGRVVLEDFPGAPRVLSDR